MNTSYRFSYRASARTIPPTTATPADATWAMAALGVALVELELEVPVPVEVEPDFWDAVVTLVTMVRLEDGTMVEEASEADVVMFALVEVETTVTVEEGTEDVVVLV